jgi:hypothetical protein
MTFSNRPYAAGLLRMLGENQLSLIWGGGVGGQSDLLPSIKFLVLLLSLTSGTLILPFIVKSELTFKPLLNCANNELHRAVLSYSNHVLYSLLPEISSAFYYHNLCPGLHDRFIPDHFNKLIKCNLLIEYCMSAFIDGLPILLLRFVTGLIYKYYLLLLLLLSYFIS